MRCLALAFLATLEAFCISSDPFWPQLEEILKDYLARREREGGIGQLLFPSRRGEKESMIHDLRKSLDIIAKRAGFKAGEIRCTLFRHTYATQRLQTLDHGKPVAVWTVSPGSWATSPRS